MARHSAAEIVTGAAVLLVAGGFLVFAVANTGRSFGGSTYALHASFDHVDGLSPGAEVRVAGVKIGSVGPIRLDPKTYQADVSFSVDRNVVLTTDSSATISTDGLLGGKYLALATGGDDTKLVAGGTITITQGSVNLEALIGKYIFPTVGKDSGAKDGGVKNGGPDKDAGSKAGADQPK